MVCPEHVWAAEFVLHATVDNDPWPQVSLAPNMAHYIAGAMPKRQPRATSNASSSVFTNPETPGRIVTVT